MASKFCITRMRAGILALVFLQCTCQLGAETINYAFFVQRAISNPDGYPRIVIAVKDAGFQLGVDDNDRVFPGPTIRGKKGDEIALTIDNRFMAESTSVHFHGLHMVNNVWMDGVGGITQPYISPGTQFTYRFNLTQTGTYWYHAHAGDQYQDGLIGPIVVDYPDGETDPVKEIYYYGAEYTLMLQEWFHERADDLMSNNQGPYNAFKYSNGQRFIPNYPYYARTSLINGRGQYDCNFDNACVNFFGANCESKTECIFQHASFLGPCDPSPHPLDTFQCVGSSIRLRLIHSGYEPPIRFWIDRHNLTMVERDGVLVVPIKVDAVILSVGQRYDVIVNCSQNPDQDYYMYSRLDDPVIRPHVLSKAVLTYTNITRSTVAEPLRDPERIPLGRPAASAFEQKLRPLSRKMAAAADRSLLLTYSEPASYENSQPLNDAVVNGVTFVMPKSPTLQEVYLGNSAADSVMDMGMGIFGNPKKTNIITIEQGLTYQFMLVSLDPFSHPWHLHGYTMDMVAVGQLEPATDLLLNGTDSCGQPNFVTIRDEVLQRITPDMTKEALILTTGDVFSVEPFSYVVFRVKMDNPGPWFFHCHINWHMEMGMAVIFSVEKNGKYEGLIEPPVDYPACVPLSSVRRNNI